jgi:hypothetical protein
MARKKKSQYWQEFSIELNGKTYQASYCTESGTVTVEAMTTDGVTLRNSTQIGASAQVTARMLLKEFIEGGHLVGN